MSSTQLSVLLLFLMTVGSVRPLPTPSVTPPVSVSPGRASGGLQADEGPSGGDDTSHHEAMGACRATCVEQTLQWPPTDEMCLHTQDCLTCWQLCELLYQDELKWRSMCDQEDCTIGCTTACKFSFSTVDMPDRMSLEFPNTPTTTEVSDTALHVSWESPQPRPQGKETVPTGRPYLVYTLLFWDDNNPRWSRVTSTLDFITEVAGPHASFPGLQFLLLASSPAGTVARAVPPYPALAPPTAAPPTTQSTTTPPPAAHDPAPAALDVAVHSTPEGTLETEVTWSRVADVAVTYVVTWGRETCNVDPLRTFCPLEKEEMTAHIKSKDREEMRVILTQLTYNSKYWLSVSVLGSDTPAAHHTFYTPACVRVDATFMTCLPEPAAPPAQVAPAHVAPAEVAPVAPAEVTTQKVTPSTASSYTSTAVPTTTTLPPSTSTTTTSSNSESNQTDRWALSAEVLLLAAGTSVFSVLVVLLSLCIYRRTCRQPEVDLAKVLQSYTHLPLLGTSTPNGSLGSLHQLHLHNVTAQSLFNSPYTTPSRAGLLAPPPAGSPFLQLPAYQAPSGAGLWPSVEQLRATSTLVHPAPASPAPTVVSVDDVAKPPQCRIYVEPRPAPSPASQLRARSMEGLNFPASSMAHLLTVPAFSAGRRSTSATDLPTTTQQPARRQIHFDDDRDDLLPEPEPTKATSGGRRASIPSADPVYQYHNLHTVPEEEEADFTHLEDDAAPLSSGRPLEWEYEDFQLQEPFRGRTETM